MEKLVSGEVFKEAFHEHFEGLHRYAYTFLRENDTAKDIVQQVFIKVWEKKQTIKITASLKSYLFTAVHNACINHHNRNRRMLPLNQETNNLADGHHSPVETKEMQAHIRAAIEKLPPQCKEVFLKNREEGKTYAGVASELGIAVKTVEAQMTKALKVLRQELDIFLTLLITMFIHL